MLTRQEHYVQFCNAQSLCHIMGFPLRSHSTLMEIRLESFYKCVCYWFLEGCIWVHFIEVNFPVAKVFLKNCTIMKTCPTLSPASTFLFSLLFHVLFLQGCNELYTAAQGWSHFSQWPALKQSPSLLQGNSFKKYKPKSQICIIQKQSDILFGMCLSELHCWPIWRDQKEGWRVGSGLHQEVCSGCGPALWGAGEEGTAKHNVM